MPLPEEARLLIKECAAERDKLRAEVEERGKRINGLLQELRDAEKEYKGASLQIGEIRNLLEIASHWYCKEWCPEGRASEIHEAVCQDMTKMLETNETRKECDHQWSDVVGTPDNGRAHYCWACRVMEKL